MKKRQIVIAIDGPSGVGKSTVGLMIARRFGLKYVDTGAMYRAIALKIHETGVNMDDEEELSLFCSHLKMDVKDGDGNFMVYIDGKDYTGLIRTPDAGKLASIVSSKRPVRDCLVSLQRELGNKGGVVLEGRDIGTVVFPDADLKFFLKADIETRAGRRYLELKEKGGNASKEEVLNDIIQRDKRDTLRELSPLAPADDSINIDTSSYNLSEVFDILAREINARIEGLCDAVKTGV